MSRVALIIFLCAATVGAQGLVPPVALMQCHQPEYTEEARIAHLAGTVTLSLTIDDDGKPNDIQVLTPVGLGLDESAVTCMRQSRYSPAQHDGKPVPFKIDVPLVFQQQWDSDWHLSAAAFRPVDGAVRPTLVKAKFPSPTGDRRSGSVCMHLTVGKDGNPRDIQVAAPKDPRFEKEAMAIVLDWRFKPGTRNRQPVDVPATLTLMHGPTARSAAPGRLP